MNMTIQALHEVSGTLFFLVFMAIVGLAAERIEKRKKRNAIAEGLRRAEEARRAEEGRRRRTEAVRFAEHTANNSDFFRRA